MNEQTIISRYEEILKLMKDTIEYCRISGFGIPYNLRLAISDIKQELVFLKKYGFENF